MEINLIYGDTYLNSGEFVAQPGLSFSVSGFALWKTGLVVSLELLLFTHLRLAIEVGTWEFGALALSFVPLLNSPITAFVQEVCGLVTLATGVFCLVLIWSLPGESSNKFFIVVRKFQRQIALPFNN